MSIINYDEEKFQAIKELINSRVEPYKPQYTDELEKYDSSTNKFFDFMPEGHRYYEFIMDRARKTTYKVVENIIKKLLEEKEIQFTDEMTVIKDNEKQFIPFEYFFANDKYSPVFSLLIKEKEGGMLYCFCDSQDSFKLFNQKEKFAFLSQAYTGYRLVSFVKEYAYAPILNHLTEESDETRGTGILSIKHFFINHFGEEEYKSFEMFAEKYTTEARKCLGFIISKSLTPQSLSNFRRDVKETIVNYDYADVINETSLLKRVLQQFLVNHFYEALLYEGGFNQYFRLDIGSFSNSFLTAEWLYKSMDAMGKIDFSVISVGYCKAVEELLYVFISTHVNEGRKIDTWKRPKDWQNKAPEEINWQEDLSEQTIVNKYQFIMYEGMINFIDDNPGLFFDESIKTELLSQLRIMQGLRNPYVHKKNLSEANRNIVSEARSCTYKVFALLLGGGIYNDFGKRIMGIPRQQRDPFQMLCEYVSLNQSVYYLENEEGTLTTAFGMRDHDVTYDSEGKAHYSGVYLNVQQDIPPRTGIITLSGVKNIKINKQKFTNESLPYKVFRGTMTPHSRGMSLSGPQMLIWDQGDFVATEL